MKKLLFVALIVITLASCSITKGLDSGTVTATAYAAPDVMLDTDEISGCFNIALNYGIVGNLMFDDIGLHYNFAGFLPYCELFNQTSKGEKFPFKTFDSLWGTTLGIGMAIKIPLVDEDMLISPMVEMITSQASVGKASQAVVSIGAGIDIGSIRYFKPDMYFGLNYTFTVHFFQMQTARIGSLSSQKNKNEVMLRITPRIFFGFDL